MTNEQGKAITYAMKMRIAQPVENQRLQFIEQQTATNLELEHQSKILLDFLNNNNGGLNLLFSFVVAISTVFYVVLTRQLVAETKRMRQAQQKPRISMTIQPREDLLNFVDLIIENIGLGAAYNVKFEIEPDSEYGFKQGKLSNVGFIKRGISYFPPNQKK